MSATRLLPEGTSFSLIQTLRILIVEDFQPWAQLLQTVVEQEQVGQVICSVCDGYLGLKRAEELKPDLVLLDIGLPNINGIDLARFVKRIQPQPLILFVSHFEAPAIVKAAIDAGGNGYVLKTQVREDLTTAIREVSQGRMFLSARVKNAIGKE